MKKSIMTLAMEANVPGKKEKEIEYIFWAGVDPSALKGLPFVYQEQWTVQIDQSDSSAYGATFRVRFEQEGSEKRYEMTIKSALDKKKTGGVNQPLSRDEINIPCTVDYFEMFKRSATKGLIKKRYYYKEKSTGLLFEIDVFQNIDGKFNYEWVKIDLEVKEVLKETPKLPDFFQHPITNQYGSRTEEENKILDEVFAKQSWPNIYL